MAFLTSLLSPLTFFFGEAANSLLALNRLTCFRPAVGKVAVFFSKKAAYCSSSSNNSPFLNDLVLINSKKHRAVASTSAVALCASLNFSPKRNSCNSDKVGSLNLPPLPPGNLQSRAVVSVHVSRTGRSCKLFSLARR